MSASREDGRREEITARRSSGVAAVLARNAIRPIRARTVGSSREESEARIQRTSPPTPRDAAISPVAGRSCAA